METISSYFKEFKEYKEKIDIIKTIDRSRFKKIKIAILSSSTIKGIKEILFVKSYRLGIIPEIFIGGYNQYNQEILNDKGELYKFRPDIIFLFVDTRSLLSDLFFDYYNQSEDDLKQIMNEKVSHIKNLIEKITSKLESKVVLHNLEVPIYSPLGIIDNKQKCGFMEFVKNINLELTNYFKSNNQIFVYDFDMFCSKWGKNNIINQKMYYLGDIKVDLSYLPKLCDEYVSYIKPLLSLTKKCIVLDLDNTLWGGIIGEDGLEGIKLGPTPEGRPFLEFQKYLLSLFNRGIILAINSKNNPEDALTALREHPHMVLQEKHFASIQINWSDKISNMRMIAEELNIGLDSLIFFDDDKLNREMIREALPEVQVVDLPEDSALYPKTLMEINDFNSFYFSEEDKKKGQMYAEQRKRVEFRKSTTDITEYLRSLGMVITIEKASNFTIPRISQLTQKTNQFNMTTRRYLEEDIKRFANSEDHLVFSVKAEDKFGDNGTIGAAIIKKEAAAWIIDSFLLSCRVIGRQIEETMLAYILDEAKRKNVKTLIGEFIPKKKNIPAKDFFNKNGFKLMEENEKKRENERKEETEKKEENASQKEDKDENKEKRELQRWIFPTENRYNFPDFLEVIKR